MKKRLFLFAISSSFLLFQTGCFKEINIDNPTNGSDVGGHYNNGLVAYYTFDDGTANDLTDNGADAFLLNGATTVSDGNGGYYLFVSSVQGGYMNIPYNFFSGHNHWSVGFWIKDLTTGSVFAAQNPSNSVYNDVPKLWAKDDGYLRIETSEYTDGITAIAYNYSQNSGTWHHYVVVADGMFDSYRANIKFYVDGVLVDNVTPRYVQSTINGNPRIQIGGDKGGSYSIAPSMKVDNIRFYSRALSLSDIKAIYNLEK